MKRWKFWSLFSPGLVWIVGLIGVFYFILISGFAAYLVHLYQLHYEQNMMESAIQAPSMLAEAVSRRIWDEADFVFSKYQGEKPASKLINPTLIHTVWDFDSIHREIQFINGSGTGRLSLFPSEDLNEGLIRLSPFAEPISSEPIRFISPLSSMAYHKEFKRVRKDTESDFVWTRTFEGDDKKWMRGVIFSAEALLKKIVIPAMETLCRQKNIEMELFDEMCVSRVICFGGKKDGSRESLIPIPPGKEPLIGDLSGFWVQTYGLKEDLEWSKRPFRFLLMGISMGMGGIVIFVFFFWFARLRRQEEEQRLQNDWILHLAHVLRGPLHSLSLLIESFSAVPDEDRSGLDECIRREIDRLDSSCRQFIRKAKGNIGQWEIAPVILELYPPISRVLEKLFLRYPRFKEKITLEIPQGIQVLADTEGLAELLENLLDNAIKYSPRGTPISLVANSEKNRVRITIKDSGLGIPPEFLTRVGEPFFRVGQKDADGIVGSGLGFHLAKILCARMEGTLIIDSEGLGKGTTVTLILPS